MIFTTGEDNLAATVYIYKPGGSCWAEADQASLRPLTHLVYRLAGPEHMESREASEGDQRYSKEGQWLFYASATAAPAASHAVYRCLVDGWDHVTSTDANCEGTQREVVLGFLLDAPATNHAALYRCRVGAEHFSSSDASCEGQVTEYVLGYFPLAAQ